MQTIRNVWAVGRNYADHAKEMGSLAPAPEGDPMIFLKAGSAIVQNGGEFQLPRFSQDVHHEVEVTFRFGHDLKFSDVTVGIDVTARDWQYKLKDKGHPWTLAKSFRDSCLLGPLVAIGSSTDIQALDFFLKINGELRQKGSTKDMLFRAERVRQYVIERFPVCIGDLLMTGTPAGVGPIRPGDRLDAEIVGLTKATWLAV